MTITTFPIATTAFTQFAFAATGGSATRNMPDRLGEVKNVKDFGAVGNGIADDTTAIQAAMDAAAAVGSTTLGNATGATVFFPAGSYVVSAPLLGTNLSGEIRMVGANMETVTIRGTVTGYIIDNPDNNGSHIVVVQNLRIVNDDFTAGSGALRLGFTQAALVDRCYLQGFNGLNMGSNTFASIISNCKIGANFDNQMPGSVGMYTAQNTIISTSILGYDTGIFIGGTSDGSDASGPGFAIVGSRIETCTVGIHCGRNVLGNLVGCGGTITGFTTERCGTAIYIEFATPLKIEGCSLTGTVGPGKNISTTTWSGGTATVNISGYTLNSYGWTSGTRLVNLNGNSVSGYNQSDGVFVTATYVNSTRFTFSVANPGGSGNGGIWSFKQQYGIRFGTCSAVSVSAVTSQPAAEVARVDLGSLDGSQIVLDSVYTADSSTWIMPPAARKCVVSFVSCDNPANILDFADLPGQSGVKLETAIEGMEYNLGNSNTATWGATAAGGGSNRVKVRYNGSNWTVVGK